MKQRYVAILTGSVILLLLASFVFAGGENKFKTVWQDLTWSQGGGPSGPLWNAVGPFDFNHDNMQEFVTSSSWSGAWTNGVYYLEATADNLIEYRWSHHFAALDTSDDNFSSVTVGDLDGDGNPEIIVLCDAPAGQDALQIFEWDPDSLSFPDEPTATWNLNLPNGVWEAGQIVAANLDNDDNEEVVVSIMDGPWGTAGKSHLMIFELQNKSFALPDWHIEMDDSLTTGWSGYTIYPYDLDKDGRMEIYTVAWDYYRMIVYENTGAEDQYALQAAFYVSLADEFCNQGLVAANFDSDAYNELYATTSNGDFWAIADSGDVSKLSFARFHYLGSYEGGLRQIRSGDLDNDAKPDLYLAGNYNEAVYDWEYEGGSPFDTSSFTQYTIFQDDTTDDVTPGYDQGKIRVAKLIPGDMDHDGKSDMIIVSSSLAADKPTMLMIEHDEGTAIGDNGRNLPQKFSLKQNFPNPFNPETQIDYSLARTGLVHLDIFNLSGQKIITLQNGLQRAGNYHYQWTGVDQNGQSVASGTYLYRLSIDGRTVSKKMTLVR